MDHFFVTLPSNSSEDVYGKQPMSTFKTRLAKPLHLDVNDWEFGLAEIIYPHSWHNINEGEFSVQIQVTNDKTGVIEWLTKELSIPSVYYKNPAELVETLNNTIRENIPPGQVTNYVFDYNELLRKFMVYVKSAGNCAVEFKKELSVVLGFGDKPVKIKNTKKASRNRRLVRHDRIVYDDEKVVPDYVVDLNRGLHTFFLYCDLAEAQLVGDANVPLLRTIGVKGKHGEVVSHSFDNIHYVPLNPSTFQDVHVHINDDSGQQVAFQYGRVIVKLHFRK